MKIIIKDHKEAEERSKRIESLIRLSNDLKDKDRRLPIQFFDFIQIAANKPEFVFRNVFQLFHDMIHYYIQEGLEEYPELEESVGFVHYDCSKLFVEDCDTPFFADRLFANRLMNLSKSFREGSFDNHIFLFEGPPGSGKSTFLNNLLYKLEEYTKLPEGTIFKTYWRIDIDKLGGFDKFDKEISKASNVSEDVSFLSEWSRIQMKDKIDLPMKRLQFSCPKHDHPILQVPKSIRKKFLDELILDENFKERLFNKKEYEWVLRDIPCNICKSIYNALLDVLGDPLEVFQMIAARRAKFNRQFGDGISVFNPGDPVYKKPIVNKPLENMLNSLLKTDNVDFVYSDLAKTNNGVLALMDIKEQNIERLKNLHGIISDGVHKVELIEERINTLFLGLVNPEDKVHFENIKSFQDRIILVNIPYVLDYNTEVNIYKDKFGVDITKKFLPQVLENFAKIIISSRLMTESPVIKKWIENPQKYSKYLDRNMLLLKMDIYTGKIPSYLSEEDIKRFDRTTRKAILEASEEEGRKGFSGRMSINIFNKFYSLHSKSDKLITMEMVKNFFTTSSVDLIKEIPVGFIDSLCDLYDYNVLQEVKEAVYFYNEKQIAADIMNYLYAINFEPGTVDICNYTGDRIEISEEYFKNFEITILGSSVADNKRKAFRLENQHEYVTKTLSTEIRIEGKNIDETTQFKNLFEKYTRNLKENSLAPYLDNDNFRRAIQDYDTPSFNSYDTRLKRDITNLIKNLVLKFGYTEQGAKQISFYVVDKKLDKKY